MPPRLNFLEYFFTKNPQCWQAGNNDHGQSYEGEVGFYPRMLANPITQSSETTDPQNAAKDIVKSKDGVAHVGNASHKGSKGSDEGHKATENNRDGTILFIKSMRLIKCFAIKPARVFPREDLITNEATDRIIEGIT